MNKRSETDEAYAYCRKIALGHYENFPVASVLLPKKIRPHVFAIYAFARHADDLADEDHDRQGLLKWRNRLHQSLKSGDPDPILTAVTTTIKQFDLPVQLFDDLISAFLQDLETSRYSDMADLLDYCRRSANPVGRLILLLHGISTPQLFQLSDAICTALQLTNFWQDVKVDLEKDRIYIPETLQQKHQVSEAQITEKLYNNRFANLMVELVNTTEDMFYQGLPLLSSLDYRLRWELRFTIAGGLEILHKIKRRNGDTLRQRPTLTKSDWFKIVFKPLTAGRK